MKHSFDLSQLDWKLAGFNPFEWKLVRNMEIGETGADDTPSVAGSAVMAEIRAIPAIVPGSVQKALLDAGILPDWNYGLNARQCEWVENRHWIYETRIPDGWLNAGKQFWLRCLGLDYCGCILLNSKEVLRFNNTHLPYMIELTDYLLSANNLLQIVFECPPRWLGQFGYTSKMTEWKPRFNYFWDWTSRLVQIGIWDKIYFEAVEDGQFEHVSTVTDADLSHGTGNLEIRGKAIGKSDYCVIVEMRDDKKVVQLTELSLKDFNECGLTWKDLPIKLWYPNGLGQQPLYMLSIKLVDSAATVHDTIERRIGFKHIDWQLCKDSPKNADPWICVANGKPVFLQGANWTPIRPNFADVPKSEYRKRLGLYRDLGFNIMRVWGGAFLEKEWFYELCDELGILVWQEFPLSSSGGGESWPPNDDKSIEELSEIVRSYIARRQHNVSLAIWCGGNELLSQNTDSVPVTGEDKLMRRFAHIIAEIDPTRRFLTTSPSGPCCYAHAENYGKQQHWDVHGPWKPGSDIEKDWLLYWQKDDSLFRSETGCPGPCSAELTRLYKGSCNEYPCNLENPLWRRAPWWVEWPEFVQEHGREPKDIDEYVNWGQQRQAKMLSIDVKACKDRFPKCGGIIIWMGHDCYPCPTNTSIIDFEGNPKPAALAIGEIFRQL